jgi:hypothetical protein
VKCPRCHKDISEEVVECPHCHIVVAQYRKRQGEKSDGLSPAPVEEQKKESSIWLFVVMLAMFAAYLIQRSHEHKPRPRPVVVAAPAAPAPSSDAPETPEAP